MMNPHMRLEGEAARHIGKLRMQIAMWHGRYRTGEIFDSSTGFRLPDGTVLFPDAAWVESGRWRNLSREEREEEFPPICPDVIFELLLPGDDAPAAREKIALYLRHGAELCVFLDVERKKIEMHRPRGVDTYTHPHEVNVGELHSFVLEAAKLFA